MLQVVRFFRLKSAPMLFSAALWVAWAGAVHAQAPSSSAPKLTVAEQSQEIGDAIAQLTREAKELGDVKDPDVPPRFSRPHPKLNAIKVDVTDGIMARIDKSFVGKDYNDTYVRWHLLKPLRDAPNESLAPYRKKIYDLMVKLPPRLRVERMDENTYEPMDVRREWLRLRSQTMIVVGFPPFEERYWGREALRHASPAQKRKIEPLVKKMESLNFKTVRNQEAVRFNNRVSRVNWITRQYRGELVYVYLKTGDPAALDRVVKEIGSRVSRKDRAAFDLMSFTYQAAFNGVLSQYPRATLEKAGRDLEKIARSAEGYQLYETGEDKKNQPRWWRNRMRNFADYSFHLVNMLQDGSASLMRASE
ncbi:MAG: hypothetical protein ACYTGQ_06690 [Planctomycetota bacterium]|jgi:hypothetical protein